MAAWWQATQKTARVVTLHTHTQRPLWAYVKIFLQGHLPSNWQPCTNDALANHCGSGLSFQNTGCSPPQFHLSIFSCLGLFDTPTVYYSTQLLRPCLPLFFFLHCPASPKGLPSFFRDTLWLFAFRLTHGCIPHDPMTDFGVTIPWKSFLSIVLLLSLYLWLLLSVIHFLLLALCKHEWLTSEPLSWSARVPPPLACSPLAIWFCNSGMQIVSPNPFAGPPGSVIVADYFASFLRPY